MGSGLTEFGPYRLGRRIAVGGMAEIFRAERRSDGAAVAIKLLLPQYTRDPELVRMLEDEARVQATVVHPNLVRLIEFGRVGKQSYLALEFVDGASLRDILRAGPLSRPLAVHVVAEVSRALVVVHAAGVVHRDVTPENILISRDGSVRLGDFGIARSALTGRTRTGIIKGKLAYLAPEQVRGTTIGPRTDLYALGLVLFESLTGEHYLRGDTEPELLRAAEAPTFREAGFADDILRDLLAVEPDARPASAADALARLEALPHDAAGLIERVTTAIIDDDAPERPGTVRLVAKEPRRRAPLWIGAAVVTSIAAGSVWLATRTSAPTGRDAAVDTATEPAPVDASVDGVDASVDASVVVDAALDAMLVDAASSRPKAPDARSAPIDAAIVDAGHNNREAVAKVRSDYHARGILDADLPADVAALLARGETDDAALADARRAIDAIRIDEPFVKRKLDRINGAIRRADRNKVDVKRLDALAAAALDDLLDGRYESCNTRLDQMANLLAQGHSPP